MPLHEHRAAARSEREQRSPWLRRLTLTALLLIPLLFFAGRTAVSRLPIAATGDATRVAHKEPVYVAVMGVDERTGDVGRADTLILVRLSPEQNRLDAVNIPRDTRISHRDGSHSKINAAYAAGGPERVTEVLSALLKIPRPYYVTLNFLAFEELVDRVGGVEIQVDQDYYYEDPTQDLYIDIRQGSQHMNGETALKYVRLRYDGVTNSDIARIERQQQFIRAVQQKVTSPSYWGRVPAVIKSLRRNVATNIPESDQLKLAENLFKARSSLQMQTLPGFPDDDSGDWLLDRNAWEEVTRSWQGL